MSKLIYYILIFTTLGMYSCKDNAAGNSDSSPKGPPKVEKTNDMKVYMHYMPWFESKPVSGYWGSHWTMATRDPDITLENGQRQIASHYYPLVGPYDSQDPAVIEYHLLLMKYAGIDGVLIDWYGTHHVNDYNANLSNSNAFIDQLKTTGLQFGIVYEEYTAENVSEQLGTSDIEAAQEDLSYMTSKYFSTDQYIQVDDNPLLLTFGPRHFEEPDEWESILSATEEEPVFLPLWGQAGNLGEHADGTFSWVDFNASLSDLESYYNNGASDGMVMGSAYPGFHDYYEEGGWGDSYRRVYHDGGETLRETLEKAQEHNLDFLQLVTWNDFGEGTMIEPTVEYEFLFLEIIQEFTGVTYDRDELQLIHEYYKARSQEQGERSEELEEVFNALIELEPDKARQLLDEL